MFGRFFKTDLFRSMHLNHMQGMDDMFGFVDDPMFAIMDRSDLHENKDYSLGEQHRSYDPFEPQHDQFERRHSLRNHMALDPFEFMHSLMFKMQNTMGNIQKQIMEQSENDPDTFSYSYSSIKSYSSDDGSGQPKVYEATTTTRQAPGGICESRKTIKDSTAGLEKMAISRQISDRGHVITRQRNVRTGDLDEKQDFHNMTEEDAPRFDEEWQQRMSQPSIHHDAVFGYQTKRGHHQIQDDPKYPRSGHQDLLSAIESAQKDDV